MRKRIKIGDIVAIPLPSGGYGYAQYIFLDKKKGPLIQVYDLITEQIADLPEIAEAEPLFGPVITGISAAVRNGRWEILGNTNVEYFRYKNFIAPVYNGKLRIVSKWFLWDGENFIDLGTKLPMKYRGLEQLVVWDPEDVAYRIETGENHLDFRLDL